MDARINIRDTRFSRNASELTRQYRTAAPFPHVMVDDFFPADRLRKVADEIAAARIDPEAPGYGWFGKRRVSEMDQLPPETRKLVDDLNSPPFIAWLEEVTGIEGLEPDPYLEGAGIHQIPPGGYLKLHTDFNWHKRLQMHRRINLLLYLNQGWDEAWGGAIEFWKESAIHSKGGRAGASYAPNFNRMVVFSTTDFSYHGHPHPLACPTDRTRDSLALYYYSKERPRSEIRFGPSTMTNYRERADEHLGLKHKLHQLLIRHPRIRKVVFGLLGRG